MIVLPVSHQQSTIQLITLVGVVLASSFVTPARGETPDSDPRAVAVADRVMEALGGAQAWDELRGLRWSFGSAVNDTVRGTPRRHAWDKHTGWHRVEGTNRSGQDFCVIHNLHDGRGKAWVSGQAIEGDSLKNLITMGKAIWINDSYWFLMPYKLRDPGVTLEYDGQVDEQGVSYDKIALSFKDVGRTPGDRYWVFVNRANDRIEKWAYVLQGREPPPSVYTWEGWEAHGGLWFPTAHRRDERNVMTNQVETVSEFREGEFAAP